MIATSDPEVFSGALLSEATFSRTDCVVFAEAPSNNPALANALTKLGYQRWASDCWTGNFKAPETDLYACILPE